MPAGILQNDKMVHIAGSETPWHGLSKVASVEVCQNSELTMIEAGQNWAVEKVPLLRKDTWREEEQFALVRSDNRETLGYVGPKYEPLQNKDAFKWFDPFLAAGEATLNTAGSLDNGRRLWILAKLNRDPLVITKQDTVDKFILLSNGHGGVSIRAGFTPIRVVCQNTLAMAHSAHNAENKLIRLRHTKNHKEALKGVREIMNTANASFEATAEQYRKLVSKTVNQKDLRKYVKIVFEQDEVKEDEISTRMENIMLEVERLFEEGRGNNLSTVRGTAWAAYNAVTEYLSWNRGNNQGNRLTSLWFGDSAVMNQRAFEAALEMAS